MVFEEPRPSKEYYHVSLFESIFFFFLVQTLDPTKFNPFPSDSYLICLEICSSVSVPFSNSLYSQQCAAALMNKSKIVSRLESSCWGQCRPQLLINSTHQVSRMHDGGVFWFGLLGRTRRWRSAAKKTGRREAGAYRASDISSPRRGLVSEGES